MTKTTEDSKFFLVTYKSFTKKIRIMFSKRECLLWQRKKENRKKKSQKCCSNPKVCHFTIQERCRDEMSTYYKLCLNCSEKT